MNSKLALCLLALAFVTSAQENTATITGQIVDSTGAGVVGASVTARNVQTGLERKVVTNETANYTLPLLPIGSYTVTAEKMGFEKIVQTDINLQVDQHAELNFSMRVGTTSNTVQVTAEIPLTQTESSSTGAVIDNTKVVELPLNGRQFYS